MKRLLYLATLSLVALMMLVPAAFAQEQDRAPLCQQLQDQISAGVGDNPPTTAELLACGISPEAISPCEGVPDPSCAANNPTISFGGPNGARANDTQNCAALPKGSPEAIACYQELVARLTGTTQTTPPTTKAPTTKAPTTKAPTTKAPTTKAPTTKAPTVTELPATGGPSLLIPAVGLLLASSLIGLGVMRRK